MHELTICIYTKEYLLFLLIEMVKIYTGKRNFFIVSVFGVPVT